MNNSGCLTYPELYAVSSGPERTEGKAGNLRSSSQHTTAPNVRSALYKDTADPVESISMNSATLPHSGLHNLTWPSKDARLDSLVLSSSPLRQFGPPPFRSPSTPSTPLATTVIPVQTSGCLRRAASCLRSAMAAMVVTAYMYQRRPDHPVGV